MITQCHKMLLNVHLIECDRLALYRHCILRDCRSIFFDDTVDFMTFRFFLEKRFLLFSVVFWNLGLKKLVRFPIRRKSLWYFYYCSHGLVSTPMKATVVKQISGVPW
jgi:hypothetical protein